MCPICKRKDGKRFLVKEMMFGTRKEYRYMECKGCGSLYFDAAGSNTKTWNDYYPINKYYSLLQNNQQRRHGWFKKYLNRARISYYLWGENALGYIIQHLRPMKNDLRWLKSSQLESFKSRILDVGCGTGDLLYSLRRTGFLNLYGIDPNISENIEEESIRIKQATLLQISGTYDCIMFHHSFEHMEDPNETLKIACNMLCPNGRIVIRTPIKDCKAWETYGVNWVQIDAPRHRVILSRAAIDLICEQLKLVIYEQYYDSTGFQFWGSEQNAQGIALYAPNSYVVDPLKSIFTNSQIIDYAREAAVLNAQNNGDQIVLIVGKG